MIKARGVGADGKPIVILGLSAENVRRLTADQPIKVECSELGLDPMTIFIVAGETEESIVAEICAAGVAIGDFIDRKTPYDDSRRPR